MHSKQELVIILMLLVASIEARPQQQHQQGQRRYDNCWAFVDEDLWTQIIRFQKHTSSIEIFLNATGPRVLTCLQEQGLRQSLSYEMTLERRWLNESMIIQTKTLSVQKWLQMAGREGRGHLESFGFDYILLRGFYQINFRLCDMDAESLQNVGCEQGPGVTSNEILVQNFHQDIEDSWCLREEAEDDKLVEKYKPIVAGTLRYINFSFAFTPCHKVLPYEEAEVSVFMASHNETAVCESGLEILKSRVTVSPAHLLLHENNIQAVIEYQTPKLEGNKYYCLRIQSTHPFCQSMKPAPFLSDPGVTRIAYPEFCNFTSATVFIANLPFITEWIPFCSSHFKCGWLYITVIGSAAFLLSFILALIINLCCCRKKRPKQSTDLNVSPSNVDTLKLADIRPKRTWSDVHEDFYREPPANPGKILLLYSPDSRQFKELQGAFRSFLELACHCVVLDLFDEELLQAIAYDPETWIDQLLRDDRFKVIVVCSQGAYKRHQAILKGEVLNIPNTDSLDGLFSAGLRFLQARQYDSGRLALARYEMLHLSSSDFQFDDLGADREFNVPSELHELFCWIHNYLPLDLLGKPWARYNLELQLLQDALKKARMDRSK